MIEKLAKADLHFHYDGSLSPKVILSALPSIEHRAIQSLSLEGPVKNTADFFAIFNSIFELFDSETILLNILRALLLEEHEAGIELLDFRFGCGALTKRLKRSEKEVLEVFARSFKSARDLGLEICPTLCFSRYESAERSDFLTEFVLENRNLIYAVDLEGDNTRPTREFGAYFRRLKDAGLNITIHAGEFAGPEQVWEALDYCGADRIGHGYTIIEDQELLKRIVRDQIPVEVCLTSNYLTGVCKDLEHHPFVKMIEAGVPVILCTDDQAIFKTSLADEYHKAWQILSGNGYNPDSILATISANSKKFFFKQKERR